MRGGRFRSKACTFPALSIGKDFLSGFHAEDEHLVSVLDLDNVIVGLDDHWIHTRIQPTTLIISLNDVKDASASVASDWTRKNKLFFLIKSKQRNDGNGGA